MFESYRDGFELFDKVRSEKNIAVVPGARHDKLYNRPETEPIAQAVEKLKVFYDDNL